MTDWDQKMFEDLASNTNFIKWARGESESGAEQWNSWEKDHPTLIREFRVAKSVVSGLRFSGARLHNEEIRYLWAKTVNQIRAAESSKKSYPYFQKITQIAAILVLPLIVLSGWLIYIQSDPSRRGREHFQIGDAQKVTVTAPIGGRITVDLPDGSKVWLNSSSEISYPVLFNERERRIRLNGEAYFKVEKSSIPFYVSSCGPEVKVYGTEFNVNAYPDDELSTIALAQGKISLVWKGEEKLIVPGQVGYFDRKKNHLIVKNEDVEAFSSWREGKYVFREATLLAILRVLQRSYNVDIRLTDEQLGSYRYNATFNNESLGQILQMLSWSAPIKYTHTPKVLHPDGSYEPDRVEISKDPARQVKLNK